MLAEELQFPEVSSGSSQPPGLQSQDIQNTFLASTINHMLVLISTHVHTLAHAHTLTHKFFKWWAMD